MLGQLPEDVLVDGIMKYLTAKMLCRLACVNRALRDATSSKGSEEIWKSLCYQRWQGKVGLKRELFPFAIYVGEALKRMSVKELQTILLRRGNENIAKFLEKPEFTEEVMRTNPEDVRGWNAIHSAKWKASLVYSIHDSLRTRITTREVIRSEWVIVFKQNGFEADGRFKEDGYFWSSIRNAETHQLYWHMDDKREYMQIGPYPPHRIYRNHETWAFEMENQWVIIKQKA